MNHRWRYPGSYTHLYIYLCIYQWVVFNDVVVLSYIRKAPMELLLLTPQFFTSSPMALFQYLEDWVWSHLKKEHQFRQSFVIVNKRYLSRYFIMYTIYKGYFIIVKRRIIVALMPKIFWKAHVICMIKCFTLDGNTVRGWYLPQESFLCYKYRRVYHY